MNDTRNYTYDAIGNMIGDVSENITNIEWSIYGKVLSVEKNNVTVLRFTYDAAGNRVRKEVIDPTDTTQVRSTYYVYEAGGKVVAIYENCVDPEPSPHEGVDTDNDGIPNLCDPDSLDPTNPPPGGDIDGDGVPDEVDPCPCTAGPAGDQDSDGIPDGTDPNPCEPNCAEAFRLAEWVIYGNGAQGRIAETKPTDLARPAGEGTAIDTTNEYHVRVLSEKYYELKDHLGNVRVVVTDMKEPTAQSGTYPFVAVVSSYANYYAFGMVQPGRSWEGGEWRFGFNGKERDDEWSGEGNVYDYGARLYDSRLGRWMSVDRCSSEDPSTGPYVYGICSPLNVIDPDGNKILYINGYVGEDLPGWAWKMFIGKYSEARYWGGDGEFERRAEEFFGDYSGNSTYINGSCPGLSTEDQRRNAGRIWARNNMETLIEGLKSGEVYNIVTHSMGAAFGEGVEDVLTEAGYTVAVVVHLSPRQARDIVAHPAAETYQLGYEDDPMVDETWTMANVDKYGVVLTSIDWLYVHGATTRPEVWDDVQALRDAHMVLTFQGKSGNPNADATGVAPKPVQTLKTGSGKAKFARFGENGTVWKRSDDGTYESDGQIPSTDQ